MTYSRIAVAVFLATLGILKSANAQERIVNAFFGVEMGKNDSCNTLGNKLLSLNSKVRREPARDTRTGTPTPNLWVFSPANVIFPTAVSIVAYCHDERLITVSLSANNGEDDIALKDTMSILKSKYGDINPLFSDPEKGKYWYTPSKSISISLVTKSESKSFVLTYQFLGSIDGSDVEIEKNGQDASKARRRAL